MPDSQPAELATDAAPKSILSYWPSNAAADTPSSSSSSTSADDDSVSGALTNKQPRLVRSSSSLPTQSASACLTVKFAPLPVIEPRKRKSSVQLGVAARSRMIQARRNMEQSPNWDVVDESEPGQGPEAMSAGEDPVVAFGRYIRGRTKNFWQRIAPKPNAPPAVVIGRTFSDSAVSDAVIDISEPYSEGSIASQDSSPEQTEENPEGGVMEDEVGEDFQLRMKRVSSLTNGEKKARARQASVLVKKSPAVVKVAA